MRSQSHDIFLELLLMQKFLVATRKCVWNWKFWIGWAFSDSPYSLVKVNKFNSTRSLTSIQVALDFIKIETRASGSVGIQGIQDVRKLYGANIVIVEDIVDTGRTMVKVLKLVAQMIQQGHLHKSLLLYPLSSKVLASLKKFQPKQVLIACLLRKRSKVHTWVQTNLPSYLTCQPRCGATCPTTLGSRCPTSCWSVTRSTSTNTFETSCTSAFSQRKASKDFQPLTCQPVKISWNIAKLSLQLPLAE